MDWNDWFQYRTLFHLFFVDAAGYRHDVGAVKIAHLEHQYVQGHGTPLEPSFNELDSGYVSLGQDESYYQNLRRLLGATSARRVLLALQDLALDSARFVSLQTRLVVSESLLRNVSSSSVVGQYARIAESGPSQEPYRFTFVRRSQNRYETEALRLGFVVTPDSSPPSNVHVIIGRNGSGKTSVLRSMGRVMLGNTISTDLDGFFESDSEGPDMRVANLIYVAFSAFDEPALPVEDSKTAFDTPYTYVGLHYQAPDVLDGQVPARAARLPGELASMFAESAWTVVQTKSYELWREALRNLESDPNFAEADVSALARSGRSEDALDQASFLSEAKTIYSKLSSGHRIVLLTVTRLVESVSERTMVLMDEPEGHLHPPLLAAFTRTLSNLMQSRNGVAIVATHSPVILQEAPAACVWKVRRVGDVQFAERPTIETFGENVGTLTNSIFGLEVTESGFHRLVIDAAVELGSYEAVLRKYGDNLGFDARVTLQAWFAQRSS